MLACGPSLVVTYEGPRRSAAEVAHITARGYTKIVELNGAPFRSGRSFEVLAGEQSLVIEATLKGEELHPGYRHQRAVLQCRARFDARPAHTYWIVRGGLQLEGMDDTFSERRTLHAFGVDLLDMNAQPPEPVTAPACQWVAGPGM